MIPLNDVLNHVIECQVLYRENSFYFLCVVFLCKKNIYIFLSGSPAELSPSTLSPVNHGMGKTLLTA